MLRKLQLKDVDLMLEWMHDPNVNSNFRVNFASFTKEDVRHFIENSFNNENQHFAVVDEYDEYQGTISLKNISLVDKNAEYAVVFRKKAQGTGIAAKATKEILNYAFKELCLRKVYLNVIEENKRAQAFYKKMGFVEEGRFVKHYYINHKFQDLYWYAIMK